MNIQTTRLAILLLWLAVFLPMSAAANSMSIPSIEIQSIAWSPDGSRIAVGQGPEICDWENPSKHAIQIYDAVTLEQISSFVLHTCTVTSLDWSLDGSRLISTGGIDGRAIVWDTTSGKIIAVSQSYSMPGRFMDLWSPDNMQVASVAQASSEIVIWNPSDGSTLNTFNTTHIGDPYALVWSPDGGQLVAANWNGTAVIWNTATGQPVLEMAGHIGLVSAVVWSSDGQTIITGGWDDSIHIWDATSGVLQQVLEGHTGNIESLALSPDGSKLASASYDGTVRIWDVDTGQIIEIIQVGARALAVDWSPDGTQLAYGGLGDDNELQIMTPAHSPTLTPSSTPTPTETLTPLAVDS